MIVRAGLSIALASALLAPLGGTAHRRTEAGNRHYAAGEYAEALRQYTEAQLATPEAAELFYDIGNVLFRQADYQGAVDAYQRALLSAPESLVPQAAYNLGNARFKKEEFREAVDAYQRALRAAPEDVDAKRNLELALRALEQQKKQPPQQQPQDSESKADEQQPPQPGQPGEGGADSKQQPGEQEAGEQEPGRLTEEQAARLLDTLADQERENLRRQLLDPEERPSKVTEKDW